MWSKDGVSLVEEDWLRDYLSKLGMEKRTGPEGMRPPVLREVAAVTVRLLSIIFK